MLRNCLFFIATALLISCRQSPVVSRPHTGNAYAKRFAIQATSQYTLVSLFGKRGSTDTTANFVLYAQDRPAKGHPAGTLVKVPCKKIASLSCIYSEMLSELGASEDIAAIDNIDYVNDSNVLMRYQAGKLMELARTPELDLEKSLALRPDVMFTFGMGNPAEDGHPRLSEAGIPVVVIVDHLEDHPLARAEWIRFFGAFTGRLQRADSIFEAVRTSYLSLKEKGSAVAARPAVFTEIRYGDVWYMPGGKSFVSTLIKDAGGKYLWDDNTDTGSLPLSFEQVYERAVNADYWINIPMMFSLHDLLAADERYAAFRAVREHQVYNYTRHRNRLGYSTYWESGITHPERVLADLQMIFHPGSETPQSFYYYERLP